MTNYCMKVNGYTLPVYCLNTVVVGTGAAGYNAADRIYDYGQKDVAIVTEHILEGTSRNTGSDKQTYYKLTLAGGDGDSVRKMAETLFEGQCVDGDIALCEAALSAQGFLKLVELGVPFPRNRYGEYVGYKTDHDPCRRATSVGPYTSKCMTECLQKAVEKKGIRVFDKLLAVRILSREGQAYGLICLDLNSELIENAFVVFNCKNIVYATGGPAGMYANSVYPNGHYGASGIAFEAGVKGKNLTEWQYGLASIRPRWNVSGTYMQVLPRFISTDQNGGEEREFLLDFFKNKGELLSKVFLKGYQWPFDVRKVDGGSSIIDILVYIESEKGRRVFLDFRDNPNGEDIDYASLEPEAREYMERAGACFGTPIERLLHMNGPAVDFYLAKGVDLRTEPLEVALCAQHNNGGLDINCWWQTNLNGFFAAGEVCASHGVYRPGGSALNAGQVGSMRCAQYIVAQRKGPAWEEDIFKEVAREPIVSVLRLSEEVLSPADEENVKKLWNLTATRMSRVGAAIRNAAGIKEALAELKNELDAFGETIRINSPQKLGRVWRLHDIMISQYVYLSAMANYMENGGKSRGSALYTDEKGEKPYPDLPDVFTFTLDDETRGNMVQEVLYKEGECGFNWREVRPIPDEDDFFENVWRNYRKNGNVY